jgi:hypothetical protein
MMSQRDRPAADGSNGITSPKMKDDVETAGGRNVLFAVSFGGPHPFHRFVLIPRRVSVHRMPVDHAQPERPRLQKADYYDSLKFSKLSNSAGWGSGVSQTTV